MMDKLKNFRRLTYDQVLIQFILFIEKKYGGVIRNYLNNTAPSTVQYPSWYDEIKVSEI